MMEYAIKDDAIEKKSLKRRAAVAALLAMAALGAHHLHGRALSSAVNDGLPARAAAFDESTKDLTGPNSLLGDISDDRSFAVANPSDLETNEIDLASANDLGGASATEDGFLDRLDSNSIDQFAGAGGVAASQSSLSAVPEPATAGLLLLAAVPVVSFRRSRSRWSTGNTPC